MLGNRAGNAFDKAELVLTKEGEGEVSLHDVFKLIFAEFTRRAVCVKPGATGLNLGMMFSCITGHPAGSMRRLFGLRFKPMFSRGDEWHVSWEYGGFGDPDAGGWGAGFCST